MIYKKIILCLLGYGLASIVAIAQNHTMYLDKSLRPTAEPTDIICTINEDLSSVGITIYDCYNSDKEILYQLSQTLYILSDLIIDSYLPYLKPTDNNDFYLLGYYKNGKPQNGFFKHEDSDLKEWIIYDFYKNGIRTEQLCQNVFKIITEGYEDDETSWYLLNQKSVYKDDILENGIKITTKQEGEATIQVLENIYNSKPADFSIGLFAIHYGEFLFIKETDKNQYEIKSLEGNNPVVSINYTDNGRVYRFAKDNKTYKTIEIEVFQQKLGDFDISELKEGEVAKYFEKNGEIYVDRQQNGSTPWNEWKRIDTSKPLVMLVEFFSSQPPKLNAEYIFDAFAGNFDKYGKPLGYITRINGALFGFKYEEGKTKRTYGITLFEGHNETILGEEKTLDEISDMFISLMNRKRNSL